MTGPSPIIQLLLATYNDGRYLDEFLRSVELQTENRWTILARDDGSADDTNGRLEWWSRRLGGRLSLLPDSGTRNLGVAGNFSALLAASSAAYLMFANPDDVWHPGKISLSLAAMHGAESAAGAETPCLVHTDLCMVDTDLRPLAPSFWKYQGLHPERGHSLSRLCVENIVWACTAMLNRPLVDLAGAIPQESHHEDWWVAMVAGAFGRIVSVPRATVDWRRHGANDSAVSELSRGALSAFRSPLSARARLRNVLAAGRPRAAAFLDRYRVRLDARQIAALEAYLDLPSGNALTRRISLIKHGLWFTSVRRNLGMMLLI